MYKNYYHLQDNPFNVTSDPEFFYSSSRHSEAFSHLIYGIEQRKGILVVTGEIGTGKTTLCRTLLTRLDSTIKSALILNPSFSEMQLLELIINDFGIGGYAKKNKLTLTNALNTFLIEQSSMDNNVVLIIDEAQNLKVPQLEQIRLLSNLETEKTKLLQIILVGQPELLDKLKLSSLRQLNQRISVRYHILPLDKQELSEYIVHRLSIATQPDHELSVHFTPKALDAIFLFSKGTPRLINIICDRALLASYVQEKNTIDEQIVFKCAREVG